MHGKNLNITHETSLFLEKFLVKPDAAGYHFINQGSLTVDNVDDREEIQITDVRCCSGRVLEIRGKGIDKIGDKAMRKVAKSNTGNNKLKYILEGRRVVDLYKNDCDDVIT